MIMVQGIIDLTFGVLFILLAILVWLQGRSLRCVMETNYQMFKTVLDSLTAISRTIREGEQRNKAHRSEGRKRTEPRPKAKAEKEEKRDE